MKPSLSCNKNAAMQLLSVDVLDPINSRDTFTALSEVKQSASQWLLYTLACRSSTNSAAQGAIGTALPGSMAMVDAASKCSRCQ